MSIVEGPNGEQIEFPDGIDPTVMRDAMRRKFNWQPAASPSPAPSTYQMDAEGESGELFANQKALQSPTLGAARAAGQGLALSYADELEALVRGLPNMATGRGRTRQEILDEVRDEVKGFAEEYPQQAAVAEITGAGLGSVVPGIGALRLAGAGPGIGRAALASGLAAAPAGAIDATGRLEGDKTAGEYGEAAGQGAAISGGIGTLFGGLGGAAGRVADTWATPEALALTQRGVRLTPGEVLGGNASRMESGALTSTPIIGGMVRDRAEEGVQSLNQRAYREALTPLGAQAQRDFTARGARAGNEAVADLDQVLDDAYGAVVPRLTAAADMPLLREAATLRSQLPASVRPEFNDAFRRYVGRMVDRNTGEIPGNRLQQSLRSLREASRHLRNSTANPWHGELGEALGGLREALENSAGRYSAPEAVREFRNVNRAYARYATVRDAASRVGSPEGVASSANLHSAVRAGDRSAGKGAFARGEAQMQGLTGRAKNVMTPKGGGSPTAERTAALAGVGALASGMVSPGTMALGLPLAALYTRTGSRAFQHLATASPRTREALQRAMRRAGVAGGAAAGLEAEREF